MTDDVGGRPLAAPADPDWSRFRGPNGTGVSAAPDCRPTSGPTSNVLWKTAVPTGHSSPVLTRTRIFLTAHDSDALFVLALDRATGREAWRRESRRARKGRLDGPNGPASPSPVTDGDRVYAFFQDFGLIALQRRGQGAVAAAARTVQPVLRLRRVTDPGRRDRDPPGGSGQRLVPARRGREVRARSATKSIVQA